MQQPNNKKRYAEYAFYSGALLCVVAGGYGVIAGICLMFAGAFVADR